MAIKELKNINQRPRYFAGQYLLEDDFELEQDYARDRLQRYTRSLHVSGIADGLIASKPNDANLKLIVNISAGIAIDPQGRQVVSIESRQVDLSKDLAETVALNNGDYILYIGYDEQESDPQDGSANTNRRILENPRFKLSSSATSDDFIAIAKLTIKDGVVSIASDSNSVRKYTGLRLPSSSDNPLTLRSGGDRAINLAVLSGSLSVTDKVGIGTATPTEKLEISGGNLKVSGNISASNATLTGNVGVGTPTPGATLEVKGSTNNSTAAALNAIDSQSKSLLYVRNDGNLGIGATSPSAKLTIQTPNAFDGDTIRFESKTESSLYYLNLSTKVTDGVVRWIFDQKNNKTSHPNVLAFDRGNVGIGTATPDAKLQVQIDGATTAASLKLEHKGSNFVVRPFSAGGTSSVIENTGGGSLLINPNGGNVGIGTTDPGSSKLKIANSASDFADISFSSSGMGQLQIIGWPSGWNINAMTPGKHLYINRDSGENSDVYIGRNGKELFVRGSDGSVGIGLKDNRANYLNPASSIGTNSSLVVASKTKNLVAVGQNFELAKTESVLTLVRDGVSDQSWSNIVDFRIGRYEKSDNASRTQLDILLAHHDLEKGSPLPNPPVETKLDRIMTLRSDGYVGIGIGSLTKNYTIEIIGSATDSSQGDPNTSLKVDNVSMNMQIGRGLNTVILNSDGTYKNSLTHDVYGDGNPSQWNAWATWVNTNAQNGDIVAVGSRDAINAVPTGGAAIALLQSIGAVKAFDLLPVHNITNQRRPYALLFIKGRIGAIEVLHLFKGPNARLLTSYDSLLKFTYNPTATTKLDVGGILRTQKLLLGNKFLLSGDRDNTANDEWLRLEDPAGPLNRRKLGFAADKLYSSEAVQLSDVRMKKDIRNVSKVLDKVLSLRGISFQWKDSQPETLPQLGMIAQEVETVFPELVEMGPNNMKAINYTGFIAILIEAIKEQQEQIEKLSLQISE